MKKFASQNDLDEKKISFEEIGNDLFAFTAEGVNTEKNGDVVASLSVVDGDEVLLMSRNGMVVRIGLKDVREARLKVF